MASNYRTLCREMAVVPPETTVRGWASKSLLGGKPNKAGRPRNLTLDEETNLVELLRDVRHGGGVLDNETILYMAKVCHFFLNHHLIEFFLQDILTVFRGETEAAAVPELTASWVRSLRRRYTLGKLRCGTTDRPPSSADQLRVDNSWREEFRNICMHPTDWGVPMPGNGPHQIPTCMHLGADETPLQYHPDHRTAYVFSSSVLSKYEELTSSFQ